MLLYIWLLTRSINASSERAEILIYGECHAFPEVHEYICQCTDSISCIFQEAMHDCEFIFKESDPLQSFYKHPNPNIVCVEDPLYHFVQSSMKKKHEMEVGNQTYYDKPHIIRKHVKKVGVQTNYDRQNMICRHGVNVANLIAQRRTRSASITKSVVFCRAMGDESYYEHFHDSSCPRSKPRSKREMIDRRLKIAEKVWNMIAGKEDIPAHLVRFPDIWSEDILNTYYDLLNDLRSMKMERALLSFSVITAGQKFIAVLGSSHVIDIRRNFDKMKQRGKGIGKKVSFVIHDPNIGCCQKDSDGMAKVKDFLQKEC